MTDRSNVKYTEDALDPSIPLVDAHHHLTDRYPKEAFIRDLHAGHNVVATVFMASGHGHYRKTGPSDLAPVGETEWLMTQRNDDGLIAGFITSADVRLGSRVPRVLEAHHTAGGDAFKGIRFHIAWDEYPNPHFDGIPPHALLDSTIQLGIAELAKAGLIFETWCYFHQLSDIAALAQRFPDLSIVLNHLGGPAVTGPYAARRTEMLEEWRRGLQLVAGHHKVTLKLGGIGYAAFVEESVLAGPRTSEWIADYWRPELRFCIETFGVERCMFESNFPVDDLLCDYVTLWNVFKRIGAEYSLDEQRDLFENTARRVYAI